MAMGQRREHELIIVGKGRFPQALVGELVDRETEHPELGPVGNLLASSSQGITSSVLVVQKHDSAHADKTTEPKQVHCNDDSIARDKYSV